VVVGDVNSTLACSLVCSKLGIRVAHVEAGLRSRDRSMPEEINRILTDHLADLLFTPSSDGDENLLQEGITPEKIHLVGNVMIDSLARMLPGIHRSLILEEVGLSAGGYVLATLHRPGNVDDPARLTALMETLQKISAKIPLVFPVHPRTRKQLAELNLATPQTRLHLLEPLGYLDFVALMKTARLVLTDSGGIQEETTYLGVPCLTVRPNTERPVTIALGTNRLVESTPQAILDGVEAILSGQVALPGRIPPLWDGKAAKRIVNIFRQL
jgi:UDP-N-acetylglucosamine 2-epimerase (non-hydrolysing)